MILFAYTLATCVASLLFTFACARVETAPAAGGGAPPPDLSLTADAVVVGPDEQNDAALAVTRRLDADGRAGAGAAPRLSPQEHMRRAGVYHANRAFDEARAHWRAVIERYPADPNVPQAQFLTGRSLFQEKRYEEALRVFREMAAGEHLDTQAGRDGFYYVAATQLRLDRPAEAAAGYAEYAERFPAGERIENAYLNTIDSLREAGRPDEAVRWIEKTRARFAGKTAEAAAVFARLRLEVARGGWGAALRSADELGRMRLTREANATAAEVAYLRAFALEQSGRKAEAVAVYTSIADAAGSYFGWRATERLRGLGGAAKSAALQREARVRAEVSARAGDYPAPFRDSLLAAARRRPVDPRFLLAIMRQESGFNPNAKSPAAARGLLQLVPEVAAKYAGAAGLARVSESDLYKPDVNIRLGGAYIADLFGMFPGLPEAVAAAYNGGEESVARWVRRAARKDQGVVASEVGFVESKDYVNKVLANYRAYQLLYDEQLRPRR